MAAGYREDQIINTFFSHDVEEFAAYRKAHWAEARQEIRGKLGIDKDKVVLLSKVEFTNLDTDARMSYTIVSPHEMNLEGGKISMKSPIGQALMGKRVGDIAEVHAPAGIMRLRIDSISLDDMA